MSKVKADIFYQHHKQLLSVWNKQPQYANIDAFIIKNGKDQGGNKIKTSAISMWYFGFDFIDTILLITKKTFAIIGGNKKNMLKSVQEHAEAKEYNLVFIEKDQANNSNQLQQLFEILDKDLNKSSFNIGTLAKEQQVGPFMTEYDSFIKDKNQYKFADCSVFVQDCLSVKDQNEISYIGKAAKVSVYLESKLIKEIETIIEDEGKKTHSQIATMIEGLIENEKELKKISEEIGGESDNLDLAYVPIVQSGGKYDLKPNAQSNEDILSYDTIIVSVGTKYMEYHANIVRTLFIDPTNDQKKIYQRVYELQNQIAVQLKPGIKLKTVYENAVNFINEKVPQLKDKIPANFGFGIGLEFRESNLYINAKNEKEVEEGMVFNVVVGFDNLQSEKEKAYAIQISDTVAIRKQNTPNAVMTFKVSKKYEDISYSIQDEGQDEEQEEEEDDLEKENIIQDGRRTRNAYHKNTTIVSEKERQKHQLELREVKLKELQERYNNNGFLSNKINSRALELDKVQCYGGPQDIPKEYKKNQIHIDAAHNAILLPVNGELVPFHISLIKNYSKNDEGKTHTLRLNFHNPGSGSNLANITFPKIDGQIVFIKELTFRSKNAKNMLETIKKIKDLQAKVKQTDQEAKNKDELVEQDKLQLRNTKRPALRNLKVRPAISKQKVNGMLELHLNGFRYMTTKNEKVDVIFKNIKHAIFQPCDNEMIVAIHFNLKNPIMIGKKKVWDVQFYTEAGLPPEDLNNRRRGHDYDEIEEEQMEKARRKKLNKDFEAFYKEVENQLGDKIKFEVPYANLGFYGSPSRSTCLLQPTQNTLMNIIEFPFFIMSLEEVELACFERMIGRLKNFDLVFIFKDYEKQVTRIASIPIDKAEIVKNWLNSQNILYFESTKSFSWANILKTIRQDIGGFIEDGGWNIILGEDEGEDEDPDEGDEDFSVEQDEEEEESEEISESDEDFDDEESASDFEGDEDLSEEGQSWSDLEENARKEEERRKQQQVKPTKPVPQKRR
uniref:FACT complex subunit n=1 Tax=Tetrahymena thermophila TaxID=5911 RepID=Q6RCP5_TETTH|nr:138K protein - Tetrahymena thermophila [Tetrahymena thermophila]AAS65456.1 p138 [Tetrahymena thermophila]